jgi:hypothetical protein
VADEEEAQSLVVLACGTNGLGEYIAQELVLEQTLPNLELFSERLDKAHDVLVAHGHCRCDSSIGLLTKRKDRRSVRGMSKPAVKIEEKFPAMCYVAVEEDEERGRTTPGWYLGICKSGESGYHQYTRRNRPFADQAQAEMVAKSQNVLLGVDEEQAAMIVASTMRGPRSVANAVRRGRR